MGKYFLSKIESNAHVSKLFKIVPKLYRSMQIETIYLWQSDIDINSRHTHSTDRYGDIWRCHSDNGCGDSFQQRSHGRLSGAAASADHSSLLL